MKDIFEGLDGMGLKNIEEKVLFHEEKTVEDEAIIRRQNEEMMRDILFDRKSECPICDRQFETRSVKSGKLKLMDSDEDLRPIYNKLDPLLYDVMVCPTCGYAALTKTFKYVKRHRIAEFKDKVSTKYKGREYPDVYSYDDGIERYKLALYGAMILEGTNLEKAYLCLKIAWLYRGKRQALNQNDEAARKDAEEFEMTFITQAYEGFKRAVSYEKFPQLGIDLLTTEYLIGELARRLGYLEEAFDIMRKLSISNEISQRLKTRVNGVKDLILEERRRIKAEEKNK